MADPIDPIASQSPEVFSSRFMSRASHLSAATTGSEVGPELRAAQNGTGTPQPAQTDPLTREQVCRWAALIAAGEDAFPADLPEPDRGRLAVEVRRLLRARLLAAIAAAIARDIDDGDPQGAIRVRSPDTEVS
jgi:hypothetical protein